jgi:hypothetical protein
MFTSTIKNSSSRRIVNTFTSTIPKESHKIGETISSKPMMIEWTKRNLFSLVK